MNQPFKHRDIQEGDTVSHKSQQNTHGITAETARVQKIDHVNKTGGCRRSAYVKWPSSKSAAWVLCENLVKVAEA